MTEQGLANEYDYLFRDNSYAPLSVSPNINSKITHRQFSVFLPDLRRFPHRSNPAFGREAQRRIVPTT
jgi:hypothetical protein